jgi:hemoglobin
MTWIKGRARRLRDNRRLHRSRPPPVTIVRAAMPPESPLDAAAIARLVDRFYDRVRVDPLLGPVFNAAVDDWDAHKRLLASFWCSVALRAGSYRGNPMAAHRPHPIRAEHFEHWLALWQDTAQAVLPAAHAALLVDYARRIGSSLRYGLGLEAPRPLGLPVVHG